MKKIILLSIIFLAACSTGVTNYNKPFIDHEETAMLEFGMSQKDVLDKIGKPLFVDSGLDSRIVWVYEVRTITVQSKGSKKGQENKTNGKVKHNNSILHEMALVFENGKVLGWGDYATYDPNHQYGFYSNCNEVSGCQGDLDDCGNCQPPVVDEEEEEENEDKTLTPKCCGENLYLIDDDGNVIDEGGK